MAAPVRVVVLGTGQMGSGILRLVLERPGLALAGVYGRRPERAGTDAGSAAGLSAPAGVPIEADLPALLDRVRPDVAVQATCSRLVDAQSEIGACVRRGIHLVSIAEEMAWPAAYDAAWAERLDRHARQRGVAVLGTGVNPGFVLDWLPIALSGACARVDAVRATRVNDLSPYGPTVLRSQGVGLTPEAFAAGVADGSVVGHVGFPASIAMIARALGWEIERVEETREPIVSRVPREAPCVRVEAGQVAGCLHRALAWRRERPGAPAVTLVHPQQVRPEAEGVETGDTLEIAGTPPLRLVSRPEIPGGAATVALAVNAIPRVLAAAPGLCSMVDLPPLTAREEGPAGGAARQEGFGG